MAKKTQKAYRRRFHGFRFLVSLLVVLVGFELVVGGVALVGLTNFLKDTPTLKLEEFTSQQSTLIFDSEGNEIADVGTQLRENITYEQIPNALIDAFLSIEDSRYFAHNGFDIPRFSKAILETVLKGNMQGGSTFTMQLVKLTYFENDADGTSRTKDIEYKIQQIAMALDLEKQSNKKEIIELYLNKMNFGGIGNIRGVEKACHQYFNKTVSQLNLSECALLAGIVNSPYYYDPHFYLDHAIERRNTVLDLMERHGYITAAESELAKQVKIEDLLIDPSDSMDAKKSSKYQAYIDEVIKEAERVTGQDPLNVSMEIHTALRPDVQDAIEEIEAGNNPYVTFFDDLSEIGILCLNNQNGEIVGIGGGRNYANGGSMLLNHATEQWQQPGSSCKPFMDYALAFEYLGWATSHVIEDKPVALGNWVFKNSTNVYVGDITIEDALASSLNTPAIQALQGVIDEKGPEVVYEYLEAMNFEMFSRDTFDIGYAIGGNNFRATPKEMAAATGIIVANGVYYEPHTITKVTYRNRDKDDITPSYEGKQVLSPQAAYMTSRLMKYVVDRSPGIMPNLTVTMRNYPVFGKTGTSDWGIEGTAYGIPEGAAKDKWMITQTTQYTTAVWLGYEKAIEGAGTWLDEYKLFNNVEGDVQSVLLDVLNTEIPGDVERPQEGLTDITHIKGLYPYTTPLADMPSEYISKGIIKSEYATLKQPQGKTALDSLSSFTADLEGETLTLNWADYPDESKLEVAPSTKDISLRSGGTILASATGRRMFDYSWVWGAVQYKARISQNGDTIKEITEDSSTKKIKISDLEPGTETQVCGYYGYEKAEDVSNEICVTVTTPSKKLTAPNANTPIDQLEAWANEHGLNVRITYVEETEEYPAGSTLVYQNNENICGKEFNEKRAIEFIVFEKKEE